MPVMDIGHMVMVVLFFGVFMSMRMDILGIVMSMHAIIMAVTVFMKNSSMYMGMRVVLMDKQQCSANHQYRSDDEKEGRELPKHKNGKRHACQWSRAIQSAGTRRAKPAHGTDEEQGAQAIAEKTKEQCSQNGYK